MRLIGGRFRGRRLPILDQPGLRPTGDRIRETLFNWLAPIITGSRCLDVFAGSGALGFEALSRGAGQVVMLERNARVAHQLSANARLLSADGLDIREADSLRWLASAEPTPFDIVFLDPPFAEHLLPATLEQLSVRPWLTSTARVYVETDAREPLPDLPSGWEWLREKTAGQVRFGLAIANTKS
ncbi:16S rRNA (guanine(966)-N(2))-methyltransferase RsmD [Thiorhodovibrio winogradskyi]|nr:16S rRNA (guanine(966)-N(2))-methyltransferase RsmD [Thiorhodovibrio winogradskyi]